MEAQKWRFCRQRNMLLATLHMAGCQPRGKRVKHSTPMLGGPRPHSWVSSLRGWSPPGFALVPMGGDGTGLAAMTFSIPPRPPPPPRPGLVPTTGISPTALSLSPHQAFSQVRSQGEARGVRGCRSTRGLLRQECCAVRGGGGSGYGPSPRDLPASTWWAKGPHP